MHFHLGFIKWANTEGVEYRRSNGNGSCMRVSPISLLFDDLKTVEGSLRKAISIGGDTDTIACMVGGISEGYYGIPKILRNKALGLLPEELRDILIRAYKFKKERSKIEVLERE